MGSKALSWGCPPITPLGESQGAGLLGRQEGGHEGFCGQVRGPSTFQDTLNELFSFLQLC